MDFNKKAQTATEYMIILAIVIIIALITAAVLGQIPSIGGGARARSSTAFWQSSEIGIVAYSVADDSNNDDLIMKIRNNRKDAITMTDVKMDDISVYSISTVIGPGETRTITNESVGNICNNAGDSFTFEIDITYTDDETGQVFSFTGSGLKLEGKCAN